MSATGLSPGDKWPNHYRGFALQVSPNGDVWWQLYQGTDRLQLDPVPTDVAETLLEHKRIGGRMHVTEGGAAITRVEQDNDEYKQVYLDNVTLTGELVPADDTEYSIPVQPEGLSPGDLWPSVYDGGRYSFVDDRMWWQNGSTRRRHPMTTKLPSKILQELRSYKPSGGSFRITPRGDVITLVDMHPTPGTVKQQFTELPRVVQNIIQLRKQRGVEMLPVYIGTIDNPTINLKKPTTLTDSLSDKEMDELSSWASNLGQTTTTTASSHKATDHSVSDNDSSVTDTAQSQPEPSTTDPDGDIRQDGNSGDGATADNEKFPSFEDDPVQQMREELQSGGSDR
jgi:hypothetical protein